jgi:hypothetical protein
VLLPCSGTTLDAQARYAAGTKEIIRRSLAGEALIPTDVIVQVRLQILIGSSM